MSGRRYDSGGGGIENEILREYERDVVLYSDPKKPSTRRSRPSSSRPLLVYGNDKHEPRSRSRSLTRRRSRPSRPSSASSVRSMPSGNSSSIDQSSVVKSARNRAAVRLFVFRNGRSSGGCIIAANDLRQLLDVATERLGLPGAGRRLFTDVGDEVFSVRSLTRDDTVYVSVGEPFRDPHQQSLLTDGTKVQWTEQGPMYATENGQVATRRGVSTCSATCKQNVHLFSRGSRRVIIFKNGDGRLGYPVVGPTLEAVLYEGHRRVEMIGNPRILYDWRGDVVFDIRKKDGNENSICIHDSELSAIDGADLPVLWISCGERFNTTGVHIFCQLLMAQRRSELLKAKEEIRKIEAKTTKGVVVSSAFHSRWNEARLQAKQNIHKLRSFTESLPMADTTFFQDHGYVDYIPQIDETHRLTSAPAPSFRLHRNGTISPSFVVVFPPDLFKHYRGESGDYTDGKVSFIFKKNEQKKLQLGKTTQLPEQTWELPLQIIQQITETLSLTTPATRLFLDNGSEVTANTTFSRGNFDSCPSLWVSQGAGFQSFDAMLEPKLLRESVPLFLLHMGHSPREELDREKISKRQGNKPPALPTEENSNIGDILRRGYLWEVTQGGEEDEFGRLECDDNSSMFQTLMEYATKQFNLSDGTDDFDSDTDDVNADMKVGKRSSDSISRLFTLDGHEVHTVLELRGNQVLWASSGDDYRPPPVDTQWNLDSSPDIDDKFRSENNSKDIFWMDMHKYERFSFNFTRLSVTLGKKDKNKGSQQWSINKDGTVSCEAAGDAGRGRPLVLTSCKTSTSTAASPNEEGDVSSLITVGDEVCLIPLLPDDSLHPLTKWQRWSFHGDLTITSQADPNLAVAVSHVDDGFHLTLEAVRHGDIGDSGEKQHRRKTAHILQRFAIKEEGVYVMNNWKKIREIHQASSSEWNKKSLSWPVGVNNVPKPRMRWPLQGYMVSCAPSMDMIIAEKNIRFAEPMPLRVHVRPNGPSSTSHRYSVLVVSPEVVALNRSAEKRKAHLLGVLSRTKGLQQRSHIESLIESEFTSMRRRSLEFFLDKCTVALRLNSAARRVFNSKGEELFELVNLPDPRTLVGAKEKDAAVLTISFGENWQDPNAEQSLSDGRTKQLIGRLVTDISHCFQYFRLCRHLDLRPNDPETMDLVLEMSAYPDGGDRKLWITERRRSDNSNQMWFWPDDFIENSKLSNMVLTTEAFNFRERTRVSIAPREPSHPGQRWEMDNDGFIHIKGYSNLVLSVVGASGAGSSLCLQSRKTDCGNGHQLWSFGTDGRITAYNVDQTELDLTSRNLQDMQEALEELKERYRKSLLEGTKNNRESDAGTVRVRLLKNGEVDESKAVLVVTKDITSILQRATVVLNLTSAARLLFTSQGVRITDNHSLRNLSSISTNQYAMLSVSKQAVPTGVPIRVDYESPIDGRIELAIAADKSVVAQTKPVESGSKSTFEFRPVDVASKYIVRLVHDSHTTDVDNKSKSSSQSVSPSVVISVPLTVAEGKKEECSVHATFSEYGEGEDVVVDWNVVGMKPTSRVWVGLCPKDELLYADTFNGVWVPTKCNTGCFSMTAPASAGDYELRMYRDNVNVASTPIRVVLERVIIDKLFQYTKEGLLDDIRTRLTPRYLCATYDSESKATLLHFAAGFGHAHIVDFLLASGAVIDLKEKGGIAPLHNACTYGHVDVVEVLLRSGADPNIKSDAGETPLHKACKYDRILCIPILLSYGANTNELNNRGRSPLDLATSKEARIAIHEEPTTILTPQAREDDTECDHPAISEDVDDSASISTMTSVRRFVPPLTNETNDAVLWVSMGEPFKSPHDLRQMYSLRVAIHRERYRIDRFGAAISFQKRRFDANSEHQDSTIQTLMQQEELARRHLADLRNQLQTVTNTFSETSLLRPLSAKHSLVGNVPLVKRVRVWLNGVPARGGEGLQVLGASISALLEEASSRLALPTSATKLFVASGDEIRDFNAIERDMDLWVSCGEPFRDPKELRRLPEAKSRIGSHHRVNVSNDDAIMKSSEEISNRESLNNSIALPVDQPMPVSFSNNHDNPFNSNDIDGDHVLMPSMIFDLSDWDVDIARTVQV